METINSFVTDDLKYTIEWTAHSLSLINNADTSSKINVSIPEHVGRCVSVCVSDAMIIQTLHLSQGSYQVVVRTLSSFSSALSTDPRKIAIPSPVLAALHVAQHSIVLITKDLQILNLSWHSGIEEPEVDPYVCSQPQLRISLLLDIRAKSELSSEDKLKKIRYEVRDSDRYLYLMESHGHRIYLAKLTAGHCDLQGCIEVDQKTDEILDFDVQNNRVYGILACPQQIPCFLAASTSSGSLTFDRFEGIQLEKGVFQIRGQIIKQKNQTTPRFLISYLSSDSQIRSVVVQESNNKLITSHIHLCATEQAPGSVECVQLRKTVFPKRGSRIQLGVYIRSMQGAVRTISVQEIVVDSIAISNITGNENPLQFQEKVNAVFQQLAENKFLLYDKNHVLIRPNAHLEQYIGMQESRIPQYVIECNNYHPHKDEEKEGFASKKKKSSRTASNVREIFYDKDSLSFLYLLILNRHHLLITDIITTRTILKKNQDACEFMIVNVEGLENDLRYLLFHSSVLESIKKTAFTELSNEEYTEFYAMVQIISEIFSAILVRKRREAFEDMRERSLQCYSHEHQAAINEAENTLKSINSYFTRIKIAGWIIQSSSQEIIPNSKDQVLNSRIGNSQLIAQVFRKDSPGLKQLKDILRNKKLSMKDKLQKRDEILEIKQNSSFSEDLPTLLIDLIMKESGFDSEFSLLSILSEEHDDSASDFVNPKLSLNAQCLAVYRTLQLLSLNNELTNFIKILPDISRNQQDSLKLIETILAAENICSDDTITSTQSLQEVLAHSQILARNLPENILVNIVASVAATGKMADTFLLIRSFGNAINWLGDTNSNSDPTWIHVLINIYLKFNKIPQAITLAMTIRSFNLPPRNNESHQNTYNYLEELLLKIIEAQQEGQLFSQELNPLEESAVKDAFEGLVLQGNKQLLLIQLKYLIYRNSTLQAMQLYQEKQLVIKQTFAQGDIAILLALFQAILKQSSEVEIQQCLEAFPFLAGNKHMDQEQTFENRILPGEISPIFYRNNGINVSAKKQYVSNNVAQQSFVTLIDVSQGLSQGVGQLPNQEDNQMIIEQIQERIMTPQKQSSQERRVNNSGQNTKSKRKWTMTKKSPE